MSVIRDEAEQHFQNGFCGIAAAFNLADCHGWKFDSSVREHAKELLINLMKLFRENEITANATVQFEEKQKFAAILAQRDSKFQTFLNRVT